MSFLAPLASIASGILPAVPSVLNTITDIIKKFTDVREGEETQHPIEKIAKRGIELAEDVQECKRVKKELKDVKRENEQLKQSQKEMIYRLTSQNPRVSTLRPKKFIRTQI